MITHEELMRYLDGALLLAEDPFDGPGMNEDGTLRFNDRPGLGVTAV